MKVRAWQICEAKLVDCAFEGEGARREGGRWNSEGVRMVYLAESRALAILECMVHMKRGDFGKWYVIIEVEFSEGLVEEVGKLPRNWDREDPLRATRRMGDGWVAEGRSAVMRVPSAVAVGEWNYLVNPEHRDFG